MATYKEIFHVLCDHKSTQNPKPEIMWDRMQNKVGPWMAGSDVDSACLEGGN